MSFKRAGDEVFDRIERINKDGMRRLADMLERLAVVLERLETAAAAQRGEATKRAGKMQAELARRYLPQRKPSRARMFTILALGAAAGFAAAYLLDPELGRGRRARLRDRSLALARDVSDEADRRGRYTAKAVQGLGSRITRPGPEETLPDDMTLVDRVESELFADPRVPKGRINIDAEEGRVILRGEVEPGQISSIEMAVRRIVGVKDVENLLHPAGTPAPNKAEAREAGD